MRHLSKQHFNELAGSLAFYLQDERRDDSQVSAGLSDVIVLLTIAYLAFTTPQAYGYKQGTISSSLSNYRIYVPSDENPSPKHVLQSPSLRLLALLAQQ